MKFAVMIYAGALLLAGGAAAQEGGKIISRTTISFATATPGGGFPLYGNAFAEVMNAADPTLSIDPRNTKGSNENIPLLEAGNVDIATVAGEPSYEAFMGIGRPKATKLKILTAMYSSPGMFVVRADSPYKTIQDLVGQPVAFGAKGSGLPILSRYILDGIGLKQDEDFKSIYLDRAGDGPAMVEDGPRRRIVGRRHRLARLHQDGRERHRRALHRADHGGDRPHPRQAHFPQAADDPRRQLS
ncbi:TRAP transporter TAXI family solute receptor [Bradyrhizobium elkanii]